jgi:hypothetical protein
VTHSGKSEKGLEELGTKIATWPFYEREGIASKDDRLLRRFLEEPLPTGEAIG